MRQDLTTALILSNDRVWLDEDLPELDLYRGDVGVVRSAWLYPNRAYEVEFSVAGSHDRRRVLLLHEQVSPRRADSPIRQSDEEDVRRVAVRRRRDSIGEAVGAEAVLAAIDASTASDPPAAWRQSLLLT